MTGDQIEIRPSGPIKAAIRPPSSKSITNRALIIAALADGVSVLQQPLASDDTRVMIDSLQRLGIEVEEKDNSLTVHGQAGVIPNKQAELFIGNSGTSVRFLTAMVSACNGDFLIDGIERMRERPIQDLLDALQSLGVDASSKNDTGCPPVVIKSNGIAGGEVSVRGNVSSQFLSGLLMASPYAKSPVTVKVEGELVSLPYVDMTLAVMKEFRVTANSTSTEFHIPCGKYSGRQYRIEPDASAASYFWAAAAITGGEAKILELNRNSLQGDVAFCDLLVQMGCELIEDDDGMTIHGPSQLKGIDCNMGNISDTAQTLSAVALFADGPTTIRGIAHNRHKETDRIGNLAIELRKFGAEVDEFDDGFTVRPAKRPTEATIDTYDDHRMAMSLSLPGLRIPGVKINDPGCTAKTYPHFFEDLARVSSW
jgi:3-phosphoshikimate 1-carboxyvinyltransferase